MNLCAGIVVLIAEGRLLRRVVDGGGSSRWCFFGLSNALLAESMCTNKPDVNEAAYSKLQR